MVDTSRKFQKKSPFWEKYIYQLPKVLRYIYQGADDPPPISLLQIRIVIR